LQHKDKDGAVIFGGRLVVKALKTSVGKTFTHGQLNLCLLIVNPKRDQ
jgi:hypothetical protein